MKQTIQPLFNHVVVRRSDEIVDQTAGGIYIPNASQEKPSQGKIVARGIETKCVENDDIVLFGKYAGSAFKLNGEELLLMKETEIIGVIHDDAFQSAGN